MKAIDKAIQVIDASEYVEIRYDVEYYLYEKKLDGSQVKKKLSEKFKEKIYKPLIEEKIEAHKSNPGIVFGRIADSHAISFMEKISKKHGKQSVEGIEIIAEAEVNGRKYSGVAHLGYYGYFYNGKHN